MKVRPLEDVLAYSHPYVIERFVEQHSVTTEEATEIFREMLKMLWLMASSEKQLTVMVFKEMFVLDEMWHTFMLFTLDYTRFCDQFLGGYLHHFPTTSADKEKEKAAASKDPEGHRRESRTKIESQCRYTACKLGPGTLSKWIKDFPIRFAQLSK
jgi:hypothetical protein